MHDDELDTQPSEPVEEQTITDAAPKGIDLNQAQDKVLALMKSEPNSDTEDAPAKELDAPAKADNAPKQPLSEAEQKAGELRQADYTRKMQGLAEERKATQAERHQISQERAQYAQQLQGMMFALQQERPPNWDELIANDPTEYLRQDHLWKQKAAAYQQAQQQLGQLSHVQQQEQEQQLVGYADQQRG